MLVLSRKKNQSVVISGGITVTVLAIKGNQIKLGIEAPQDVPICRSELLDREVRSVVIGPFVLPRAAERLALAH
jgi:carbon storage regulator